MRRMRVCVTMALFLSVLAGAVAQPSKPQNQAIQLDGKRDYVSFGDEYKDLTAPFSISAWAYLQERSFYQAPIFTNRNCVSTYNGFRLIIDKNYVSLEYGDGFGSSHPAFRRGRAAYVKLAPATWNHIAAVVVSYDSICLYVNGVNVGGDYTGDSVHPMRSDLPDGFTSAGYFVSNDVENWFKGMLDDIRLWDRALSEDEIRIGMCHALTGNEPGLIGWWDFAETDGSTIFDKSPRKVHGTFVGKPVRVGATMPCPKLHAETDAQPERLDIRKEGDM